MSLQDCVAVACTYLDDAHLHTYITELTTDVGDKGQIWGLFLTGLTDSASGYSQTSSTWYDVLMEVAGGKANNLDAAVIRKFLWASPPNHTPWFLNVPNNGAGFQMPLPKRKGL